MLFCFCAKYVVLLEALLVVQQVALHLVVMMNNLVVQQGKNYMKQII